MASFRYWRVSRITTQSGGGLALSALYLHFQGVRVDDPATLTSSAPPDVSGVLANLKDADLSTSATWSTEATRELSFVWDFGAPTQVEGFRVSGLSPSGSPLSLTLEGSVDAVTWGVVRSFAGIIPPLPGDLTELFPEGASASRVSFDGANGAQVFPVDFGGSASLVSGSVAISTEQSRFGGSSLKTLGSTGGLRWDFPERLTGRTPFTLTASFYFTSLTGTHQSLFYLFPDGQPSSPSVISFDLSSTQLRAYIPIQGVPFIAPCVVPLNTWVTISVGIDALGLVFAYLDGAKMAPPSNTAVATGLTALDSGMIGTGGVYSTPRVSGYVDEAHLWVGSDYYLVERTGADLTGPFDAVPDLYSPKTSPLKGPFIHNPNRHLQAFTPPDTRNRDMKALGWEAQGIDQGLRDFNSGVLGSGIGRIRGTVKVTPDTPVRRRVFLARTKDLKVLRTQISDPVTGAYDFQFIDELQKWTVVSFDYTNEYRAVIADNLEPELMP